MKLAEWISYFKIFLLLRTGSCAFSSGRIKEGQFEYSEINGWYTVEQAELLCEKDLQCAGFTFYGVLTEGVEFEVYFFHYVTTIHLSPLSVDFWGWTSYTVSRDFVVIPDYFWGDQDEMINLGPYAGIDLLKDPAQAAQYCRLTDNCAGLTQIKDGSTVLLENVYFWNRFRYPSNWTTLILLRARENQVYDVDHLELDRCCPATADIPYIDISGVEIPMEITRVHCSITKEEFIEHFVRRNMPVMLEGCLDEGLFSDPRGGKNLRFGGMDFDQILERLFNRGNESSTAISRPALRRRLIESMREDNFRINYTKAEKLVMESLSSTEHLTSAPSFTHTKTPNDATFTYRDILEYRASGRVRVFLKLSNLIARLDCYQKFREPGSDSLREGHEQCLVLDGLWKPPPMPDDLFAITKYDNDLAWIIMSAQSTGSQLHVDPDLMGAWNLLLTGRKWWAIIPYKANVGDFSCESKCSPGWDDGSHAYPWFNHIIPQLKDRRFYGKQVVQFVQQPGDVLYLPHGMPHTIFNIDDNVALTENYLFSDALPDLVAAIATDQISRFVKWNETQAFKIIYNQHANKERRNLMRATYQHISKLTRRFWGPCAR